MTEFLDELARSMAKPLPRRRALRLLGGAVVAATVPGFARTTTAHSASGFHTCERDGGRLCECNCRGEACQRICCEPKEDYECDCGPVEVGAGCRCIRPCGSNADCCKAGQYCASVKLRLCCEVGHNICGRRCCKPNEECVSLRVGTSTVRECDKRCPEGQAWCDQKKCCPRGWSCVLGPTGWQCRRCRADQVQCREKCCNKGTQECCGKAGCCDKSKSRCCGKAGCCPKNRSCCVNGPRQVCCPARTKCAIPVLAGNIGIVPKTPAICCPTERLNNQPKLCCPRGQVALNSPGFRTPPPGISPYCCPPSQVCGSAGNQYCANFQSDPANCGSCGNVCASGICSGGICALP